LRSCTSGNSCASSQEILAEDQSNTSTGSGDCNDFTGERLRVYRVNIRYGHAPTMVVRRNTLIRISLKVPFIPDSQGRGYASALAETQERRSIPTSSSTTLRGLLQVRLLEVSNTKQESMQSMLQRPDEATMNRARDSAMGSGNFELHKAR